MSRSAGRLVAVLCWWALAGDLGYAQQERGRVVGPLKPDHSHRPLDPHLSPVDPQLFQQLLEQIRALHALESMRGRAQDRVPHAPSPGQLNPAQVEAIQRFLREHLLRVGPNGLEQPATEALQQWAAENGITLPRASRTENSGSSVDGPPGAPETTHPRSIPRPAGSRTPPITRAGTGAVESRDPAPSSHPKESDAARSGSGRPGGRIAESVPQKAAVPREYSARPEGRSLPGASTGSVPLDAPITVEEALAWLESWKADSEQLAGPVATPQPGQPRGSAAAVSPASSAVASEPFDLRDTIRQVSSAAQAASRAPVRGPNSPEVTGGVMRALSRAIEATGRDMFERARGMSQGGSPRWWNSAARKTGEIFAPAGRQASRAARKARVGLHRSMPDVSRITPPGFSAPSAPSSESLQLTAALLLALGALVLGIVGYRYYLQGRVKSDAEPDDEPLVPPDLNELRSRSDLVRAFETLALLRLGGRARFWTHQRMARELSSGRPGVEQAVHEVTRLYELARYMHPSFVLASDSLEHARRSLRQLQTL